MAGVLRSAEDRADCGVDSAAMVNGDKRKSVSKRIKSVPANEQGWAGTNSKCNIFVCLMIYSTSAAVLLESGKRGLLSTFQWPFEWPLALPILVQ